MNNYKVSYDGLWLGGVAIVRALCEEDALNLVKCDSGTCRFNDVEIELIDECGVLYNDNGDY